MPIRLDCFFCKSDYILNRYSQHIISNHIKDLSQEKYNQILKEGIASRQTVLIEGIHHCFACKKVYKSALKARTHNLECPRKDENVKFMMALLPLESAKTCEASTQTDFPKD
jgi:hypothetical protein